MLKLHSCQEKVKNKVLGKSFKPTLAIIVGEGR